MKTNPQKNNIMTQEMIEEAYNLANHYNATREEAVQIGIQMALQGEVVITEDNKVLKIE